MATRLKPTRINVDNTPRVGDGAAYQNDNDFHWSMGGGDMSYIDFEWHTLTGTSLVIEDISNNITPSSDFTVSAGTVKPGIEYVLRVNTGNTPYTMTLGTGVINPNSYKTELKPNTVNQFKFIATSTNQLELEGVDSAVVSEINWGEIDGTLSNQTDLQNALNTKANVADANTKTFYLSSTSDLTNAQAALDWYLAGKNPIIVYLDKDYILYNKSSVSMGFRCLNINTIDSNNGGYTYFTIPTLSFTISSDTVTGISEVVSLITGNFLRTGKDYSTPYTPEYNGSPATKKYVDDQINAATAGAISDVAYGSSWDGVTGIAPSKNVVYDKINAMDTTIGNKANDSDVVKLTGDQTVSGTKTFSTSPVVPSKTTDATNTGTAVATEAQVYKKQDTLVSGTNIKTVNSNSLLGSGDLTLNDVKVSSTAPSSPTEGMVWYDTTNDQLKVYDGSNWNVTGKEYNAGPGISIGTYNDYSAMQGPAPDDFHVPSKDEWVAVYNVWTALGGGSSDGTNFGIALKLPFPGGRSYSSAGVGGQGSYGVYWSSSRDDTNNAYSLLFYSTALSPQYAYYRAYGFSVRCFKNSPVIPTSSWTKLYGISIENGGIFRSSTDGLISMSSDGQTWITISDKNLGATTVWNSGDTLSEANCGKYYQRGNNYGFPRASDATITTSSTQVDASTYGPGNYYSSDTFITRSSNPYSWDTTDNGNLWGGETGVVTLDNAITNTGVLSVNGQTGNVTISGGISLAPTSLPIKYHRYGTQTDYEGLSQYYTDTPGDTAYFTI